MTIQTEIAKRRAVCEAAITDLRCAIDTMVDLRTKNARVIARLVADAALARVAELLGLNPAELKADAP